MPGLFGDIFREVASTLINVMGANATLKTTTSPAYNKRTGVETPGTTTEKTIVCSPPTAYNVAEINNTTILFSDTHVYVAATDLPVAVFDNPTLWVLNLAGSDHTIVSIQAIYSDENVAAYKLQLRR